MPKSTLEAPAWIALSDGAQRLYTALKAKADNKHNTAYLSTRDASAALGRRNRVKVREWYAELEHYGFIVMLSAGSLGTDGRGKAPTWRLADKGTTRGGFEPAMQEFLRWDGVLFDPKPYRDKRGKTESRNGRGFQGGMDGGATPGMDGVPLNNASGMDGGAIEEHPSGMDGCSITSLTTSGGSALLASTPKTPSKPSVVDFDPKDPRMLALKATERRLRNGKSH